MAGVKSTLNWSTVARPNDGSLDATLALTNTVVAPATYASLSRLTDCTGASSWPVAATKSPGRII